MSEALDRLKKLGAQKIYEDTHIPINQVQAILYENFDGMTKVQFVGFVSILEREYREDLSFIREKGLAYFDDQKAQNDAEFAERIFIEPEARKKKMIILLALLIVILLIGIFFTVQSAKEHLVENNESVKNIESVVKTPEAVEKIAVVETNASESKESSTEDNESLQNEQVLPKEELVEAQPVEEQTPPKEVITAKSLKIEPKTKVWLGYIDVKTNKKYQKTVKREFSLDPTKEWLLLFGHGYVTLTVDDKEYTFAQKETLRLHYKDGKLTQISEDEFKRLNKGRKW